MRFRLTVPALAPGPSTHSNRRATSSSNTPVPAAPPYTGPGFLTIQWEKEGHQGAMLLPKHIHALHALFNIAHRCVTGAWATFFCSRTCTCVHAPVNVSPGLLHLVWELACLKDLQGHVTPRYKVAVNKKKSYIIGGWHAPALAAWTRAVCLPACLPACRRLADELGVRGWLYVVDVVNVMDRVLASSYTTTQSYEQLMVGAPGAGVAGLRGAQERGVVAKPTANVY